MSRLRLVESKEGEVELLHQDNRLEESKDVEVELLHQDNRWARSKTSNRRGKNATILAGKHGRMYNNDREQRAPNRLKNGLLDGEGDEDRGAKMTELSNQKRRQPQSWWKRMKDQDS